MTANEKCNSGKWQTLCEPNYIQAIDINDSSLKARLWCKNGGWVRRVFLYVPIWIEYKELGTTRGYENYLQSKGKIISIILLHNYYVRRNIRRIVAVP